MKRNFSDGNCEAWAKPKKPKMSLRFASPKAIPQVRSTEDADELCSSGFMPFPNTFRYLMDNHSLTIRIAVQPYRHASKLHIDDGWMGGGTEVRHNFELDTSKRMDYYNDYFLTLPNGNPSNRQGIFRYAIFGYEISEPRAGIACRGDAFVVADAYINSPAARAG